MASPVSNDTVDKGVLEWMSIAFDSKNTKASDVSELYKGVKFDKEWQRTVEEYSRDMQTEVDKATLRKESRSVSELISELPAPTKDNKVYGGSLKPLAAYGYNKKIMLNQEN